MSNLLSLYNSEYLNFIIRSVGNISVKDETPIGIKQFTDSFSKSSGDMTYLCVLFGLIIFMIIVFTLCHEYKKLKDRKYMMGNDPDLLFTNLQEVAGLTVSEKKLINEMVSATRLKHPSMCLLSPGMLDWSRQLWLKEKGSRIVTAGKIAQIDEISVKLYDHQP